MSSSTPPGKRSATPRPPSLGTEIRVTDYPDRMLFVESDYRYPDAWFEIDPQHACKLEDWE